jgi:hypothetical protein
MTEAEQAPETFVFNSILTRLIAREDFDPEFLSAIFQTFLLDTEVTWSCENNVYTTMCTTDIFLQMTHVLTVEDNQAGGHMETTSGVRDERHE